MTGVDASRSVSGRCVCVLSDTRCSSVRPSEGVRVASGGAARVSRCPPAHPEEAAGHLTSVEKASVLTVDSHRFQILRHLSSLTLLPIGSK